MELSQPISVKLVVDTNKPTQSLVNVRYTKAYEKFKSGL